MNNNNNENLRNKINSHRASINDMHRKGFSAHYIAGATIHHEAQIRALQSELARRWRAAAVARNEPRRRVRAAKVIQRAFKNMYHAPSNRMGTLHGRGYRKTMARLRGHANTENLNRNALKIARLNYNARHNEGQGRLVEARNMANNLRMQYGVNAANNALRRARNAVRRANA